MKKKIMLALMAMAMGAMVLTGCGSTSDQDAPASESTGVSEQPELANPWTESDQQGVEAATGFTMTAPDGASDVSYSYMSDNGTAQMKYTLDGAEWTYRMMQADGLTDISGMLYDWSAEEEGSVSGMSAAYYTYAAPAGGTDDDVQVVNWYDAVVGVTYSLSAVSGDLDGIDMQAYAERLYVTMQGDSTGDAEEDADTEVTDYFLGEHKRDEDGSTLIISDNGDGTFKIDISIVKLCRLENGVGTFEDHKMTFEVDDPSENKLSGVIYVDGDSLSVKITDSTWTYLPSGDVLEGFVR